LRLSGLTRAVWADGALLIAGQHAALRSALLTSGVADLPAIASRGLIGRADVHLTALTDAVGPLTMLAGRVPELRGAILTGDLVADAALAAVHVLIWPALTWPALIGALLIAHGSQVVEPGVGRETVLRAGRPTDAVMTDRVLTGAIRRG
jgi:hypothetical protein